MDSLRRFSSTALALALCALALTASREAADAAASSCTAKPYAYAGLIGHDVVSGVRATITAVAAPSVTSGHVAAWVGVGGRRAGPNGEPQWIQVGISGLPGGRNQLFYEITQPGRRPQYTAVVEDVEPGESYTVAVVELPGRANWWRVEVDGRVVSPPVYLPGSYGKSEPVVTAESWNGGTPSCNAFSYRFTAVGARRNGTWRTIVASTVLSDHGYGVLGRTAAGFLATRV